VVGSAPSRIAPTAVGAALLSLAVVVGHPPRASTTAATVGPSAGKAAHVLKTYCVACHGQGKQEGDVRFDALETIDTVDLQEVFVKAREAVHLEEMPPPDARQPTAAERAVLLDWITEQLKGEAAQKLEEKLRRPDAGNYVDHDELFSGKHAHLPGFTEDRRWLISQYIFDARFNRLLKHSPSRDIDGKRRQVIGDNNRRGINLTNPFLLPDHPGIRYFADETLNGGHLQTMLVNAKDAAAFMMRNTAHDDRALPAARQILALENKHIATLAARRTFLEAHIARVLEEVFQDRHQAMLPEFVRVERPSPIPDDGSVKKAGFASANPGQPELVLIFRSMRRNEKEGQTDAQLIEACEREWFYLGHDERTITMRVAFLTNFMPEWRRVIVDHFFDQRHAAPPYRPPPDADMQAITRAVLEHRSTGDRFNEVIEKCMARWEAEFEEERVRASVPPDDEITSLVEQAHALILERPPTADEADDYVALVRASMTSLGRRRAIEKLLQTLLLTTEFAYRNEFGTGEPDEHGRRMLSPRDASYAIAYALTDSSPDAELATAAAGGRLRTRADYEREVRRMLAARDRVFIIDEAVDTGVDVPNFTTMPIRELRFFRDFFGYPRMLGIFKDQKRFGGAYSDDTKRRVVAEADMLVEHIVESDEDVFRKLLTTEEFYVYHSGDNQAMQAASDRIRRIVDHFKDEDWRNFTLDDLARHKDFIAEVKMRGIDVNRLAADRRYDPLRTFKTQMESFVRRLDKGQTNAVPHNAFPAHGMGDASTRYNGRLHDPEVARMFNVDLANWHYPTTQPAPMPHRKGILTHPAWLIAFAGNTASDPIHRGIWIREKLLADTIPDVPITVDAVIPENPHQTLRQRLDAKTDNDYCMRCHRAINPLGLPFEIYDDFGRYRTEERLDLRDIYKTLPVDARGSLEGTGDGTLDGEVADALDLIDRLAKSDRVRQSMVRHAFRYFLGRNETLSDSKTLIDADRAYVTSGGSFDELVVSLLTSDSFIYRKPATQRTDP
jgi:mono/diheme cytochrome c family protein